MVPTTGAEGVAGGAAMVTLAEATEVHPLTEVTVKLYVVPAVKPEMVAVVPVPATVPGLIVQLPAGRPLSTTLPVAVAQVG